MFHFMIYQVRDFFSSRVRSFSKVRAILLGGFFVFCGCSTPIVLLTDSEINRYAIVEIDLQAWLGDNTKGEFAYVSHIDGIWEEAYRNKKSGRLYAEGPLIKYVLIDPGAHDLTLVYNKNSLGSSGRKVLSGGVTEKANLAPGKYYVRYHTEGDFVTLWLEDSQGRQITERRRSVIADATPKTPTIIPVIIPR